MRLRLAGRIGDDIVTASGLTLPGADDERRCRGDHGGRRGPGDEPRFRTAPFVSASHRDE